MEIQENISNPKLFSDIFSLKKTDSQDNKLTNSTEQRSLNCMKYVKEKFRTEGRKSDIQLKLEQKRFSFLNDGVCKKYEEDIFKFFDGFFESKTQPKILTNRLLENFETAEKSGDENKIFDIIKILRKITCIPKNEPVLQEIVLSKIMNYLDIYFDCNFAEKNKIENEILWVYINLTTLSQKKNTLLDFSYIISKIIKRLASANDQTKIEMIFWFFYNLCVDNIIYRRKLLESGIIDYIMKIWNELSLTETCKHNLIELVLALSQEKNMNSFYYEEIMKLFPIIEICFQESSENNLIQLLWIIKYLTDFNSKNLIRILSMASFDNILNYLMSENIKIAQVSLKIINNILSGENEEIKFLYDKNILGIFNKLILSDFLCIRKEVCFGISNICAGSKDQIDLLFQHDVLNEMIKLAFIDDISVKMEVGVALANLCFFADKKQHINLINRGMFNLWNDLLSQYQSHDVHLIVRILEALENVLFLGLEIMNTIGVNPIKLSLESTYIPKILFEMQDHQRLYKIAYRILDKFLDNNSINNDFEEI